MTTKKILLLSAITTICFSLTGCNNNEDTSTERVDKDGKIVLNVYNCADYICETNEEDGTIGVIEQFEELYPQVKVNYSTFETNEDMYNQLAAGGVQYDLVCPSEYMIQKLIMNDMVEPLDIEIENYNTYGSKYIQNIFNNISAKTKSNQEVTLSDYAVPYMWGTVGFMYDPEPENNEAGLDIDSDVRSWEVIWNEDYKNRTSLKDSIRDTYIVGAFHVAKNELLLAKKFYEEGKISASEYKDIVTNAMNRCDDQTINLIESSLTTAKEYVYEFEVDTGKEHIVKGDYWINLCWSGDAVYSLDLAEEEDKYLNFVIPEEGSNIWFDGWCMPKGANKEWAQKLMNFLCDPAIASQNMDYVGYTSAISGQEMWELVYDWYDDEGEYEYDLTYFFQNSGITDEDGNLMTEFIIHTSEKDRQLYAQYPDFETINRCAVMADFGDQYEKVNEMWIRVKGNSVSWIILVAIGLIVLVIVYFEIQNIISKRARKNRSRNR